MLTFEVKYSGSWEQRPQPEASPGQVVGYRAPGAGVLVVEEGVGWVMRQDGSRENVRAKSVVIWDTGDWVEYGSDGGFKACSYWADQEPWQEWEAQVSEIFGSGGSRPK
jgi:hypothetical protein